MSKVKKIGVGIDLGTTYSCVGVFRRGKVEIIANDQGNRVTPSYVAFTENERFVGDPAKAQIASNPKNTIYGKFIIIINIVRRHHCLFCKTKIFF